jgi:hypothetical protein
MTKEEFLDSGLLEEYVMGLLSEEDSVKVGDYIAANPSIEKLYKEQEKTIMKMAVTHGITPPSRAKDSIMEALNSPTRSIPNKGFSSLFLSAILPLVLAGITIYSIIQWRNVTQELNIQKSNFATLSSECDEARKKAELKNSLFAFNQNPDTEISILNGNDRAPSFDLLARHNKLTSQLSIEIINPIVLSNNKILCLWGDKDGEMILISKLDEKVENQLIAFDPEMESLNITIEDNVEVISHPDVNQLIASEVI